MTTIEPVTLVGRYVTLEPLHRDHHDDLVTAATDGELWNLWYTSVPRPEEMRTEIDRRLASQSAGSMLPFTARRNDTGTVIGMTTYLNIDAALPRLEVGSTWNARSAHGSGTNPDSKLLLLRHAFEVLGCVAIELRAHCLNHQSRAAIERLGAKQDGVLRNHMRTTNGTMRDTAVYSILPHECRWCGRRCNTESPSPGRSKCLRPLRRGRLSESFC